VHSIQDVGLAAQTVNEAVTQLNATLLTSYPLGLDELFMPQVGQTSADSLPPHPVHQVALEKQMQTLL